MSHDHPSTPAPEPARHGHDPQRAGRVEDPVCGMWIQPQTARGGAVEHDGRTIHFCNPRCREKFVADPARYLSTPGSALPPASGRVGPPDAAAEPAPAGAARDYVCPMHPEIVSDRPGACPECGMALEPRVASLEDEPNAELADMQRRFWVCLALALPTVMLAMGDMIPGAPHVLARSSVMLQMIASTPVVVWGGWPFFQRGLASLRSGHLNMFTLIALGTGAAYAFSLIASLLPSLLPGASAHGAAPVYFESAAVIVTLALLGQVLELRARGATSGAIRALLGLSPKTARRVLPNGAEEDVPLAAVAVGDELRVRPGERMPVDGSVITGSSSADESTITGEPVPVAKGPGASVTGGTINLSGSFVMRAERVGPDTLLAQIVALVGKAQRSRAPIQRLADVVSSWFVPAVIAISIATFLVWLLAGPEPRWAHALTNAVSVLIIACPCALGLATPMSIMVGMGRGAHAGVLVKDAEALERLERVDTLVVDKTGTLTRGKPELVGIAARPGFDEGELLRLAAALEVSSEHPLSTAIVAGARTRGLEFEAARDFRSVTGQGVTGLLDGRRLMLGNVALLTENGVDPSPLADEAERRRSAGQTVVLLALDGALAGLLAIADPIKAGAREALDALRSAGLEIVMLTGDHATTARAVAQELGIEHVRAEVSPTQKHDAIAELRSAGAVVAMAGDGVNDAPALAAADVGIAMGTGTDIAIQSASVTLVHGQLDAIVRARHLSRAVMRNIRQNLFLAFVYNGLGVPLAAGLAYPFAGLLLSPMLASLAMALSSVSVIVNALGLRRVALGGKSEQRV